MTADSHDGQGPGPRSWRGTRREELFQISVPRADPDRAGRAGAAGNAARTRLFLPPGCVRPLHGRAWCTCPRDRYTTPVAAARPREILREAFGGRDPSSTAPPSATRRWPGLHVVVRAERGPPAAPRWTRAGTRSQAGRPRSVRGDEDLAAEAVARLGEEQAGELLSRWAASHPGDLQG